MDFEPYRAATFCSEQVCFWGGEALFARRRLHASLLSLSHVSCACSHQAYAIGGDEKSLAPEAKRVLETLGKVSVKSTYGANHSLKFLLCTFRMHTG